jgi:hypothetical protein
VFQGTPSDVIPYCIPFETDSRAVSFVKMNEASKKKFLFLLRRTSVGVAHGACVACMAPA